MSNLHVTIKDVAKYAKVSTATVSRVINNDESVSTYAKTTVATAINILGYNMNRIARSLKTRSTRTIGVLAPKLSGDFFMFIAESLDRELRYHGYSMVVSSTYGSINEESLRLKHFAEQLVDGVVIIPASNSGSHFEILRQKNIPVVLLDRTVEDFKSDAVIVDNEDAAYRLVTKLIEDGHRRIGYVGGGFEISTSYERFAGYKKALIDNGLSLDEKIIKIGHPSLPFGYRAMQEIMKSDDVPSAIFLVNAFTHVGATNYMLEFCEHDTRNQHIIFAAFDEMPYSPLLRYCKYSVQQPIAEMGKLAARLIIERISRNDIFGQKVMSLNTKLITHKYRRNV